MILLPLDSTAINCTWHLSKRFEFKEEESKNIKLRLFDARLVYKTIEYDSVHLVIYIDNYLEKWRKEFTIYPNSEFKYQKSVTKYKEGKPEYTQWNSRLNMLEKQKLEYLINSSGINFYSQKHQNKHLTHAVYMDLNIYNGDHRIRFKQPRIYNPGPIGKLVYFIYGLEQNSK